VFKQITVQCEAEAVPLYWYTSRCNYCHL